MDPEIYNDLNHIGVLFDSIPGITLKVTILGKTVLCCESTIICMKMKNIFQIYADPKTVAQSFIFYITSCEISN